MRLNINNWIYLVYTCSTPYVCSHIILLYTPTIADVTKIAHRERVPNGALPKLGRVLTPLWGRTTPSCQKRRLRWRCASLFHELLCHHENMLLPWVVLVWQTLYRKELLANQDIIAHWYYWTRLLIKISSFTGCKSFLKSLCVHGHMYCFHHRLWSCAWSQTYGTVTRQSIRVHQWCSCLDIQEYVYGTMVVINNISSLQSLCVTIFIE